MKKILLVIAVLLGAIAATASPASAETTITASLSASTVRVGTLVYVQGKVDPATATPSVVVQRAVDHQWVDRASGSVNSSTGAYRIAIRPSQTGTYKLRVRSNGGSRWSETFYLKVTAPPTTISAGLSATTVYVGDYVQVRGTVRPATAITRVVAQRNVGGAWSDRQAGSVNQTSGAFAITIQPGQAGTYVLRVRSNGGSVVSNQVTLTVRARPTTPQPSNCDPNYTPCVPIASDVDCAGGSGNGPAYVRGPVRVIGRDIYGLDSDGDGIGCE